MGLVFDLAEAINLAVGVAAGESTRSLKTKIEDKALRRRVKASLLQILNQTVARAPTRLQLRELVSRPSFIGYLCGDPLPPTTIQSLESDFSQACAAMTYREQNILRDELQSSALRSVMLALPLTQRFLLHTLLNNGPRVSGLDLESLELMESDPSDSVFPSTASKTEQDLRDACSRINIGMPAERLQRDLGEPHHGQTQSIGHSERYIFDDADLMVLVEGGVVRAISVTAKAESCYFSFPGRQLNNSSTTGISFFGHTDVGEVRNYEICLGNRPGMRYYVELVAALDSTDPSVWIHGWKCHGNGAATDWELMEDMVPSMMYPGNPGDRNALELLRDGRLSDDQVNDLKRFRDTLPVRTIGLIESYSFARELYLSELLA